MIISRYLIKEVFYSLLAVTFILLLIFLSNQLIRYLKYAASGKIAANILMQLMGFEIPYLLALLLPLGLYLGIIFSYGRLAAENEIPVMKACGLSTKKLVGITSAFAFAVMLVVLGLMLWINPYLAIEKDKLIKKSVAAENILDSLVPGRFQMNANDDRVVYVESITRNHKQAHNLFIAEENQAGNWNVLSATTGYQMRDPATQQRFMVATDGYRYEGIPGQNDYKIIQFQKYAVRISEPQMDLQHQEREVIPTNTLWTHYANHKNAAELQWRFSIALSVLILALLAIPLSEIRPRQSRYVYLIPAILLYIVYINLLFVSRYWIENKIVPVFIGMWWVHLLFLGLMIILLLIQSRKSSLRFIFKTRK